MLCLAKWISKEDKKGCVRMASDTRLFESISSSAKTGARIGGAIGAGMGSVGPVFAAIGGAPPSVIGLHAAAIPLNAADVAVRGGALLAWLARRRAARRKDLTERERAYLAAQRRTSWRGALLGLLAGGAIGATPALAGEKDMAQFTAPVGALAGSILGLSIGTVWAPWKHKHILTDVSKAVE